MALMFFYLAPAGVLGVFVLAFIERVIPVIPSSALFTGIGMAAASGEAWCLPVAALFAVLGSFVGAFGSFRLGGWVTHGGLGAWGTEQFRRRNRRGALLRQMRREGATLPFTAQLIPTARILAPFLGGALGLKSRSFLWATFAGLAVWNLTFIAIGYTAAELEFGENMTVLSFSILFVAFGAAFLWRRFVPRHGQLPELHRKDC